MEATKRRLQHRMLARLAREGTGNGAVRTRTETGTVTKIASITESPSRARAATEVIEASRTTSQILRGPHQVCCAKMRVPDHNVRFNSHLSSIRSS